MKWFLNLFAPLPIAGAIALFLTAGCSKQDASAAAGFPPTRVIAADVTAKDVPLYLDEIGHCVAREVVNVQPQVSGKIVGIHFVDGANLKKGDPLFTIDPRPYQAALDQAQAQYEKDKATAANARANTDRQKQLYMEKLVSPADYDLARYTADADDATVRSDAAAIQSAKLNLEYCTIDSPIEGRASMRQVDNGNVVRPDGSTVMLTIQRLDPIYVDFTITEADLPAVRRHMAQGTLKTFARIPRDMSATASATAGPDEDYLAQRAGDLTFLDNAVIQATGTVNLRATIPNRDQMFWPGQFVRVRLILQMMKNVPVIPAEALQLSQQGTFVYVIKPDNTVQPRPVQVGQRQGDMTAIQSGLAAGEKIVKTGQLTLFPGAHVEIVAPATQPTVTADKSSGEGGKS